MELRAEEEEGGGLAFQSVTSPAAVSSAAPTVPPGDPPSSEQPIRGEDDVYSVHAVNCLSPNCVFLVNYALTEKNKKQKNAVSHLVLLPEIIDSFFFLQDGRLYSNRKKRTLIRCKKRDCCFHSESENSLIEYMNHPMIDSLNNMILKSTV